MIRFLILFLTFSEAIPANELTLGRLFHTPEQRARIDSVRRQTAAVHRSEDGFFRLDGEVRRSSGKDTHWINGQTQSGRPLAGQLPGQIINRHTGEVVSPLGDGIIQIHPSGR